MFKYLEGTFNRLNLCNFGGFFFIITFFFNIQGKVIMDFSSLPRANPDWIWTKKTTSHTHIHAVTHSRTHSITHTQKNSVIYTNTELITQFPVIASVATSQGGSPTLFPNFACWRSEQHGYKKNPIQEIDAVECLWCELLQKRVQQQSMMSASGQR